MVWKSSLLPCEALNFASIQNLGETNFEPDFDEPNFDEPN